MRDSNERRSGVGGVGEMILVFFGFVRIRGRTECVSRIFWDLTERSTQRHSFPTKTKKTTKNRSVSREAFLLPRKQ